MNHKLLGMMSIVLILEFSIPLMGSMEIVSAKTACDSDYVTIAGKEIIVYPTGVDDTANLQCAFDEAAAAGSGVSIRLAAGIFNITKLLVDGSYPIQLIVSDPPLVPVTGSPAPHPATKSWKIE